MRNTTKLKLVLQLYSMTVDLEDEVRWNLIMRNKLTGAMESIEGDSWSAVVEKAYRMLKKKMKEI